MPKQRNFDKLYKSLNVHHEQETPRIPESERPSNQCQPADHSIADSLFEEYSDGRGLLIWKGHIYRFDDEQLKQLRECLMKDLEGENNDERR